MTKKTHSLPNNFLALLTKEVYYNYLISPLGFIFSGLFSLIATWLFLQDFFLINQASLEPLFNLLPFLFLFFLPAITMNLFAEEKKSKTWEILLTLPVNEKSVVLAKFLSAFIFTVFTILLTLPLVIIISILGKPDWGIIAGSYLGTMLLAGGYIAAGMFFSSLSNNPVVAFLASTTFLLINFLLGQENLLSRLPDSLINIFSNLSLNFHFIFLIGGNIALTSLIFYLSWIFIFIWLTIASLKSRDY